MDANTALTSLWSMAGGEPDALDMLCLADLARSLPSVFRVDVIAAASIGLQALAAAQIWRQRTGRPQRVEVSGRRALAMFRSERYLTVDGRPPPELRSPITGYFEAVDGRWIQLHANFPHHLAGILRVLQCDGDRASVARAIARWQAAELDQRLADAGLCAALVRTPDEWQAHPQAAAIASLPLFEIIRIGDALPESIGRGVAARRPLSGVRMLDLSRVIAAPVAGRTFAQHGAQVLAIGAAHLPNLLPLVIDNGRGKRSAHLDLRTPREREVLLNLVKEADVFLQAYRPSALAAFGLSPEALCALRPGLVQVTLSAYGHLGPWAQRRGFDSLVQSATGIAWQEGQAAGLAGPGRLPCQALDHATGFLAAFGAMMALRRREQEGGSWLVRVSLAQTGRWLQSLGLLANGLAASELGEDEVTPWLQTIDSPFGRVCAVAPVEQMSLTPPHFDMPPVPLGTHPPAWLDASEP
ncbi:CoA transferase [Pandoraea sp.]|uniref:CoA transferase n=1 Tax=Pandoraea sp. TaxID=1883445 RepID=UPI0011F6053A|nr:MAG: CoA transferase [Pandoraea sp.]TAM17427.1 MAG: CoA transferase [Pandoraea sp.]